MIKAIRSESDYASALTRINQLMDAEPGTPEGDELDVLADLVELYELHRIPMEPTKAEKPKAGSEPWDIACQFLFGISNRRKLAAAIQAYADESVLRAKLDD